MLLKNEVSVRSPSDGAMHMFWGEKNMSLAPNNEHREWWAMELVRR